MSYKKRELAVNWGSEKSTVPPALGGLPIEQKEGVNLYDLNSGESERMLTCSSVLIEVIQAMSNREFNPKMAFDSTIFLMPFPKGKDHKPVMEVRSFDHEDTSSPLYEITHGLLGLTSFKDADINHNLPRDERINLVKALTEYFAGLRSIYAGNAALEDLQIDYLQAIDSLNKMEWTSAIDKPNGAHLRTRVKPIHIGDAKLMSFKMKLGAFFLEKMRTRKDQMAKSTVDSDGIIPTTRRENGKKIESGGLDKLLGRSKVESLRHSILPGESRDDKESRRNEIVEHRLQGIKDMAKDFMAIVSPGGALLNSITSMMLIGEIGSLEPVDETYYMSFFKLDERAAKLLARRITRARTELALIDIQNPLLMEVMTPLFTEKAPQMDPVTLAKLKVHIK